MATLLTKLLDGNGNKGSDPMIALMMKQIEFAEKRAELAEVRAAEERKSAEAEKQRAHEKELKAMENQAKQASPTAMVKEVLELQRDIAQLGSDEPRNWKEKLVDQGFAALPDILNAVKGYAQRAQVPAQPRPAQPQTAQPTNPNPPVQTQPQGEPVQQQTEPPLDADVAWLAQKFERNGPDFVEAFRTDPLAGAEAARPVIQFKPTIHERIARMGRAKVLLAIECLPQMKVDLFAGGATQEMLNEFIDDFIAGPDDEPDDDPDDPDEGEGEGEPVPELRNRKKETVKA